MSPSDISSYLSTNILTISISSITPIMYLSMDTIKCASKADHTQNVYHQCSGVVSPQLSICTFLLIMMVVKVLIAPLSTATLPTRQQSHRAQSPPLPHLRRRPLFLPQLYLFANMEGGRVTDSITGIAGIAGSLALIPLSLELFHMIFHRAHRTSLALPPQHSLTSPPPAIYPLPPTDSLSCNPTEGGVMNAFV